MKKTLQLIICILFLPLSLFLYLIGFRRLCVFTDRIGHLAIEPDTLLKAQYLGLIPPKRWFILAPPHRVSNQHLLHYWQRHFLIFRSNLSCFFLNALSLWPPLRYDVSHFINRDNSAQLAYKVNHAWGDRPPILQLTEEDEANADTQFPLLGLPKEAWYVCIHAREGGFSPIDEALHAHRNSDIEHLIPAISAITKRGGWVIRLGDPTMKPLNKMPQVIDYAHHPLRSARLDILLCARARFILGNTSGIFIVGSVFGVPSALSNMIPMPTLGFHPKDLSIPKLYRDNLNQYLPFKQVMMSPISHFRYAKLYERNNVIVEENSAEDILSLTLEMLDRLSGDFIETIEDKKRHDDYVSLFTPNHYSYGAASKTSFRFLNRHRDLL